MNSLLIIYPKDETTSFLKPIIQTCSKTLDGHFTFFDIGFNDEEHEITEDEIRNGAYTKVLFLGHGSSRWLQGSKNQEYEKERFINSKNIQLFKGKDFLCLSCKSIEFLEHEKRAFNYIGFGDLPTQMNEIVGIREQNANIYQNVDEGVLIRFRNMLNKVISNSIVEWIQNDFSITQLYHRIRIRVNKEISAIVKSKPISIQDKALLELVNDMKDEMGYFQSWSI